MKDKQLKIFDLEFHFWQELEKIILEKYTNLKPIIDSTDRFSIEKIKQKVSGNQYGVIFDKLQVLLITKDKSSVLKIIKDSSFVEKSDILILEKTLTFKFPKKFKSQEDAEFIAKSTFKLLVED